MKVLALIPLAAWALFFVYARCRRWDWRISLLAASATWGCALTLLTEILSFFAALNRPCLTAGWTALAVAAGALAFRTGTVPEAPKLRKLSATDKFMVLTIIGILASTFVISVVSPPNNNDSMTYHMSRVMHWFQQGSIAHFPTNDLRQLELNPWSEFAILHFQILSGGDHLANMVQWFSMTGCLVGVSLIAGIFGASPRGQLLSALIAATIPMAILQSSSTQNDLVVSFWLVCFVYFGLKSMLERSPGWSILMSISLGLAILTKGTAYIFASPFVIWFVIQDLQRSWRRASTKYLMFACLTLLLNIGHFQRNYQLFHNPLHSGSSPYANGYLSARVVLSNILRNLTLHSLTPSFKLNSYITGAVDSLHTVIGINVDDPATTWPGTSFNEKRNRLSPNEDGSGNPLHLYLFLAVILHVFIAKKYRKVRPYASLIVADFILFCIMLRWQPWHSRLHLPMFILFSPIAGLVVSEIRKLLCVYALTGILSCASLPWVLCNQARPLISLYPLIPSFYPESIFGAERKSLYFVRNRDSEASFVATADKIRSGGFRNIALIGDSYTYEYPLWALTRTGGLEGARIEYVNATNVSNKILLHHFTPDVTVRLSNANGTCEASIVN